MTDGQDVGSLWLDQAREAVEQRRFADAVATHVRFHEHVLDHDPGMRGVRASFAVGDWGRLAVAYPPARDAMIATRDRAVARLKDPSVLRDDGTAGVALDDLQGVVALNRELRRPPGAPPTRSSHVRIYADRVGQVLTVLRCTGRPDQADRVAAAAITAVARPDVAAAVRTRLR